jgi:hypothetical protein
VTVERFDGHIAGFGTAEGTRIVVGIWRDSPFGDFADVMVERADGERVLLAPSEEVAAYVASTYRFDSVVVTPVRVSRRGSGVAVDAAPLVARFDVGGTSWLGRLLRLVPGALATRPFWLRAIDPIASRILPGARTAGSAGGGRREYYGVTSARRIVAVQARWNGADLGPLARLHPPVRFGFGSAPADPHIVRVLTTIVG